MRKSHVALAALALVVASLAVPAVRHLREAPPPRPPAIRLTLGAPSGAELGSGDEVLDAAISPNERQIVFVATRGGTTTLWRRALDADDAEALAGTEGAQGPAWTQAADAVSFFADGRLKQISLTSGAVTDLAEAPSPAGAAWLPDGSVLFAPQAQGAIRWLHQGTVSDATRLHPRDAVHVYPATDLDSGAFIYTAVAQDGRRMVRWVRGDVERDLMATTGHGQLVGNLILYVRDNVLLAQALDGSTGVLEGRPTPVSTGVGITSTGRGLFAASRRILLTAVLSPRRRTLVWFDLDGQRTGTSGEPGEFWQVRLSPDDTYAAVTMVAPLLRTLDVVLVPTAAGNGMESLTRALAADSDAVWAPDGRLVLFRSLQKGPPGLFVKAAHDTDADDEALLDEALDATPTDWRADTILFHAPDNQSDDDIWAFDRKSRTRKVVVKSGFNDTDGRWSPDLEWIAHVSDESGGPDIYITHSSTGERMRVSFAGGARPRWSRDGRSLFFLRGQTIMRATRQSGTPARFAPAVAVVDVLGVRDFDVAHQRDALLVLVPVSTTISAPVSVLVDWRSTLSAVP